MSRTTMKHEARKAAGSARVQARQAAAKVKPLARSTSAAARRGTRISRAWAAPRVERAGQLVRDKAAPKISAALSSAARRIEPARPRKRWPKVAGVSGLTAAAGAIAALVRRRAKPDAAGSTAKADTAKADTAKADTAKADTAKADTASPPSAH
jgi:hypothetical protein